MNQQLGVLRQEADGIGVRLERRFDGTAAELWPYLTAADLLSQWITPGVAIDARVGGRILFPWPQGPHMEGEITVFDPPYTLEYVWREGAVVSTVRLELREEAGSTVLVIDHSGLPQTEAGGFAAGWHAHLDWLALVRAGEAEGYDNEARFRELAAVYGWQPPASSA